MKQLLVYSDSLTWGIIPNTRKRLQFDARWPGVLEDTLIRTGIPVRVIEDCLNGRRTVWDDPFKPGRNGLEGLAQRIEINSPLDSSHPDARNERLPICASVHRVALGARHWRTDCRDQNRTFRTGNANP